MHTGHKLTLLMFESFAAAFCFNLSSLSLGHRARAYIITEACTHKDKDANVHKLPHPKADVRMYKQKMLLIGSFAPAVMYLSIKHFLIT